MHQLVSCVRSAAIPVGLAIVLVIGVSLVTNSFAPTTQQLISVSDQTASHNDDNQPPFVAGTDTEVLETSADTSQSDTSENVSNPVSGADRSAQAVRTPVTNSSAATVKPQQQPTSQQQTQTVSVSLQINSALIGEITLEDGANHCDVLSAALGAGIIDDLQLKYHDTMKSYGVHVINGQGDSNIVWWVYIVNGKSPPLGCSHILVNNNDTVNWKYIGR